MKTLEGDILKVKKGIIVHQVNCQKKAGAGLALKIRKKFNGWYRHFLAVEPVLGKVDFYSIRPGLTIASVYGQKYFGREGRFTNYEALKDGFIAIRDKAGLHTDVYIPKGIGCGLGGGNWTEVEQLLIAELPQAVVIDFKPPKINFPQYYRGQLNLNCNQYLSPGRV